MTAPRIRSAARAVVLDPDDRVLLVRFVFPDAGERWALPGGGLEPDETHEDALRRELAEEVGLHDAEVGPHIWNRLHVIPFINGRYDGQEERVHLVRTEPFEPRPALSWDDLAAEYVFELRWWRIDEITDGLPFVPASLRTHLDRLLTDGPPNPPVDVGV
jgi:8-oxo-dGTP pyrophosphatase MutT (NUDIX family)